MISKDKFNSATVSTWLTDILSPEEMEEARVRAQVMVVLQDYRRENGLTQKQLANMLGVTQSLVSRWENAEVNFQISTLMKISKATGTRLVLAFEKAG